MLCVGWRLGVDFLVKVGRHEAEAQEAFAAVNLPSEKCPAVACSGAPGHRSGGHLFYLYLGRY